jgi:DNA-binding NarL/FixJ family response regulator
MDPLTLLIVDDEPAFRSGLRALLRTAPGYELAGEAADGAEAVRLAAERQPDVILMDLNLPGINGLEATRRILHASPHIGILMLTMYEDDDSVFAALRAGARGYLLKGALKAEILRAVQTVGSGGVVFGAALAQRMMRYFAGLPPLEPRDLFPELTDREREVLALIAQAHSNSEIAARLVLSEKTVRNHITNIFSKLQVADRAHAIVRARAAGLGLTDPPTT